MDDREKNRILDDDARAGARKIVAEWKACRMDFISVVDGRPQPWESAPLAQIFANAKVLGVEVLSLADPAHVTEIEDTIVRFVRSGGFFPPRDGSTAN